MGDLFISNVRFPWGEEGHILLREGRISALGPSASPGPGADRVEGNGRLILPAAIDTHVHFRQPGGEHKETLHTGAAAAVKGGVGTCLDMPNTSPRTTTVAALNEKIRLAEGAAAEILFNFGAEPDNLDQVRLAATNPRVRALKIYMGPSTGQGGLAPGPIERHFQQAGALNLPVIVHAEDLDIISQQPPGIPHDAVHHTELRPPAAERKAVSQALDWAKRYGVRLVLAHVTQPEVIEMVRQSGLNGQVLVEVCPHHLFLSTDNIVPPVENRFKVNPPLRNESTRKALLPCLAEGIDVLGSDHAPHTLEEKQAPYESAPSGIPGVEYLLPLTLEAWHRGWIGLERLIALTSGNAARFFGLNKGRLEPGVDADVVLVDPKAEWIIGQGQDRIQSKCAWTVYDGYKIHGTIDMTLVKGRVVYQRNP